MALTLSLPAALDGQLKRDSCVTSFEYHVMAALSDSPGRSLPMSVLATLANGSMSRVSHVVARLEQAGWVERQVEPAHRLSHGSPPDRRGMAARCSRPPPAHVQEARRLVVDVLSPEEFKALGAAARKIVQVADPRLVARLARSSEAPG